MPAPSIDFRRAEAGGDPLHEAVSSALGRVLETASEAGRPLPPWVERELRAYLTCGDPAYGFSWYRCDGCDHQLVLPFSCKGRGFCPSCGGRRMNQTAANLVDRVLPHVPVRQWVLSLPFPLRLRCAWSKDLLVEVRALVMDALRGFHVRRARALGLPAARYGGVCFTQRFGSALNLNVHFHALVLDGVYVEDALGVPRFHPLPEPTQDELDRLVRRIRRRCERLLHREGLLDDDQPDPDDGLLALQAASAGHRAAMGPRAGKRTRTRRSARTRDGNLPRLCAEDGWYSLHAGVRIQAHARDALERLCRYVARPPLSLKRLSRRDDGLLEVRLKTPWRDGTTHLVLSDDELVQRLAALVPPPWQNQVTYYGVLAPADAFRPSVVPEPEEEARTPRRRCPSAPHDRWIPWAELLERTFGVDVLACTRCGGRLRLHAVIHGTQRALRWLRALEARQQDAAPPPARAGPSWAEERPRPEA